jgi:hypothetical protein
MPETVEQQINVCFGEMVESCAISDAKTVEWRTKSSICRRCQEQPNPVAVLHIVHDIDMQSLLKTLKGQADAVSLASLARPIKPEHERRTEPSSPRSEDWSTEGSAASFPWP